MTYNAFGGTLNLAQFNSRAPLPQTLIRDLCPWTTLGDFQPKPFT